MNSLENLAGKKILIVDDSVQMTGLLQEVFVDCGADVTTTNSGHSAMIMIQLNSFDLIVLDLLMPKPNGWDVLHFMRNINPALLDRVMLLTGDQYHRSTMQGISNMDLQVIFKPFDVEELRIKACRIMDHAARPLTAA